jgi:signal peptide peptidase-like protein 3
MQAVPGMLVALVLCFDNRKNKDLCHDLTNLFKGQKYIRFAMWGYFMGLIAALAAGVLTHSPQPALLYLVCCHVSDSRNLIAL